MGTLELRGGALGSHKKRKPRDLMKILESWSEDFEQEKDIDMGEIIQSMAGIVEEWKADAPPPANHFKDLKELVSKLKHVTEGRPRQTFCNELPARPAGSTRPALLVRAKAVARELLHFE